ncbi:MAG: hypothetical protein QOG63_3178, partial [Thermoleophilaceae bacterium]|nr:hypothetical protein [Thermoleophilaceae bacterium]
MWARTKAGEAWAALGRPRVAIAAIVAIALVLLHRDGYGAAKALFLAFVLAVAAVALPRAIALVRDKGAAERRLLIACAALGAWLVVSLPIALAHGTAATEWLRDASAYGLLVVAPVLAILLRSDAGPRWVGRVVVLAGAVCAASFFVYWLSVREYADLPIARLLLPSFYLPAALVAYASARALRVTGLSRAAWIAAAAAVLVVLAATGSRISAILVAAPLALLALPGRRRALAAVAAAAVVLVGVLALLGPVLGVQNSAIDRLASAKDFFVQPSNDPSWRERSQEARNAVDSWSGSPIVGVGPGHHFHWRNIRGTPHDSFLIDSPAAYLAKFGIVGVVLLLALAAALADFIRRRLREGGELAFGAEALLGFCAIALLGFFVGVPMEDKGFPLAVLLLCALAIRGRADPPGATAFRWSPRRLALAAAAAAILIAVAVLGGALSSPPPPHFVTNASTAPEHLLARFESALWHGRGAEACGLMTPAMRTRAGAGAYGGAGATCERRIGGLARGSAELGNTRVTGPIRETRDGVAWYTVSRRTVPDELYRVRRSSAPGGWAIDSFAELPARPDAPTVALADGLDAGLIGPGQAFVVNAASPPERALQRFEIALWRGKGSDACGAVTAPMRTAVVDGDYGGKPGPCERRLGTLAPNSLALVGASVSGPVGATTPSARWYLVRRPTGKAVLYRLRLRGGRWLIDGFSPLDVASEADPRARVDALGSRLIGPRDAFVVNARTAPEVALSQFESALWHGSGKAACAAATSRMRATVVGGAYGGRAGSCDRRLADLARKSLALVG